MKNLQQSIEQFWTNRELLNDLKNKELVKECVQLLNDGTLRVADCVESGKWVTNEWLKKAILLYFTITQSKDILSGDLMFYDKVPLKNDFADKNVRVVPPATARYGAYIAPNVVLMPSFVNIGAYVDSGTMVDTWATVGSCAQIGKNVHLSGGVGIGGVLEPIQAQPVVIEDNCFIGSRCIVVEGAVIQHDSVLGAGVVITASTHIIDVTGTEPILYKGIVPPYSVVVPGVREKMFPAGKCLLPCAYIIGKRSNSTDKKVSLNDALRIIEN